MNIGWASDVKISMPVPPKVDQPVLIDLGGFGFTAGGLAHNVSKADVEEIFTPFFTPDGNVPS